MILRINPKKQSSTNVQFSLRSEVKRLSEMCGAKVGLVINVLYTIAQMSCWKNTVALVTGGASGLGKATAERFLKLNAKVIIADLPSSDGDQLAEKLGPNAMFVPTDVTDENEVKNALDLANEKFGNVNVGVNCAGIGVAQRTLSKKGPHDFNSFLKVLQVNTGGTFNVLRLIAERYSTIF